MRRIALSLIVLFALPIVVQAVEVSRSTRPNIILIMADDLGYETIGANGGTSYPTPHLDRLATTGARFTHCFVQPLCTPTRVQMMTGLYNVRNYINFGNLDPRAVTFGNLLKQAGYATCIVGKWQLGHEVGLPKKFGFDESCLWQHTRRPPRYANPGLEINGVQKDFANGEYGPELVNDYALDFITRKKDGPFFLYYPMILTHSPYQPTPDSPDWDPKAQGEQVNQDAKHFGGMVTYMDKMIGRLVARLEALGIRDNTLLIFLGDNGTGRGTRSMMGDRVVIGGKGLTTDAGMHVPLIASWPGRIRNPIVCSDLVDSTDFVPTILDAAGVRPRASAKLDGRTFLPQLLGAEGQPREWIYSWYSPRQGPNMTAREFTFNHHYKLYRTGEFFDLGNDLEEKQPLTVASLQGEAAATAKLLQKALDQFQEARPAELDRMFEQANQGQEQKQKEKAKAKRKDKKGATTNRPNILFLFADDQRADTIGAHGNPHLKTPNIDKLATAGFSFRSNYCFGGNSGAVCVPSRAMLMSGKTWFHVDTATLKGARLLPEVLGENGYVTFGTGKWHNGQPSWLRAFQRGKAVMFGGMSDHTKVPVRDLGPDGTLTAERIGEKFSSELFADAAIEFLRRHDGKKPFFAYVAFTAPHDPRQPPVPHREMYYRNLPPLPANFLSQHPFDNGAMRGGRDENLAPWPRTEAVIRDQLAEYYGLITHMDEQIGRILDTLRQTGQVDNTLIIYAADQGLAVGSHGLLGKQSVYEHSMHCPLIFVGPGIPQGKSTQAFSYLLDVFPTLCDVLGMPRPADLEGESLRPLWEGRRERVRDSVFLPYIQIQRAVRDERWKLICYPKIGHMQLFDLQADPDEKTNLIDRAEYAPHVQRLLALMRQWQARVGDKLELPTESRPAEFVDLTGRTREPDKWQPDWIVKKYF